MLLRPLVNMHPVVQQLLALQQVDARVATMRSKVDSIPRETARRQKKVDDLSRQRDAVETAIEQADGQYQELETKVSGLDTAIKRQQDHRDQSNNASSFTAAQHQIEYLNQDKEALQNEQLELMERIEQETPKLAECDQLVAAETAEFEAFRAESQVLADELRGKFDEVVGERGRHLDDLPEQSVAMYEELFESTAGTAVVAVDGSHCTGCYTRLTPNDMAFLLGGSTLITCKSCGRILYLAG